MRIAKPKRHLSLIFQDIFQSRRRRFIILAVLLVLILGLALVLSMIASRASSAGREVLLASTQDYFYPLGLVLFALSGLATVACLPTKLWLEKSPRITFWRQIPEALGITAATFLIAIISFISLTADNDWLFLLLFAIVFVFPVLILAGAYFVTSLLVAAILLRVKKRRLKRYSELEAPDSRRVDSHTEKDERRPAHHLIHALHSVSLVTLFIIGTIPGILVYIALLIPILNHASALNKSSKGW